MVRQKICQTKEHYPVPLRGKCIVWVENQALMGKWAFTSEECNKAGDDLL